MRKLLSATLLTLSVLGLGGALWLARADAAMGLRARLPQLAEQAAEGLRAHPACESDPGLAPDALLATLRADLDDPGCPGSQRVVRLVAEQASPRFQAEVRRLLASRRAPERARLRISLALLRREGELSEPIRAELRRGGLSPRSQERLVAEMSEMFGPEVVESLLSQGGAPRYDAGHSLAAWRLAGGDLSARAAVIEALEHELARPTLATSEQDLGLSARRARLAQAALAGLGLDMPFLRAFAERQAQGLPAPGGMPGTLAMALEDAPPPCERITEEACGRRLIELLELPPEPFEGWLSAESNEAPTPKLALPEPWDARVAALSVTPELVEEAAAWVKAAPERPAGRLLGVVGNRDHAYGPTPLMAGQRGDPSDAVRYGGATPGATAISARALAEASGVELEVLRWEGELVLQSGGLRVFLGECGPGTGAADPALFQLEQAVAVSDEALVTLAWTEQLAGRMALGDLEGALALWARVEGGGAPEQAASSEGSPEGSPSGDASSGESPATGASPSGSSSGDASSGAPPATGASPGGDPTAEGSPGALSSAEASAGATSPDTDWAAPAWPASQLTPLRGALLAAQGVRLPGLRGPDAALAASWALAYGHPETAEAIAAAQPGAPSLEALLALLPEASPCARAWLPPAPVLEE
ncbi:MAG: hypothetical protein H6741_10305 [Alphaproteobacteria bacterium]|nr:hypothetical protein [Alphaproteobacteria bacterium]